MILATKSGNTMELRPTTEDNPAPLPTFAPAFTERQVNTRGAASGGRHRPLQEVSLQYSLCNEPWLKYTFVNIADRGLKRCQWTSSRLQEEAIFFETRTERFQLARAADSAGSSGSGGDQVRPPAFDCNPAPPPHFLYTCIWH